MAQSATIGAIDNALARAEGGTKKVLEKAANFVKGQASRAQRFENLAASATAGWQRTTAALKERTHPAHLAGQTSLATLGAVAAHQLALTGYDMVARGKPDEPPGLLARNAGWASPLMIMGLGGITAFGGYTSASSQAAKSFAEGKVDPDNYGREVIMASGISTVGMGLDDFITWLRTR